MCAYTCMFSYRTGPQLSSVSEGSVTQKSFRATSLVLTWLVMNLTKYNWAVLHWVSFYSASTYTGGRHDLECFCFPSSIQLYLLIKNCFFSLFVFCFFFSTAQVYILQEIKTSFEFHFKPHLILMTSFLLLTYFCWFLTGPFSASFFNDWILHVCLWGLGLEGTDVFYVFSFIKTICISWAFYDCN